MLRWLAIPLLSCAVCAASSAQLRLAWDPSPDAVDGYRLYAGTNSLALSPTNALVKIDAGTNLTAVVNDLLPGRWFFVATAYQRTTNGIPVESAPSNEIMFEVPAPPPNLFPVIVQWNGEIGGPNWSNSVYLKFKLGQ